MCYLHLCCLSKFYIISCGCPLGKLGILEPLQHDLRERGEKDLFLFPQSLLDPPANGNLINCLFEIRRSGDKEDATWPRMEGANQPAPKERGNSKVATTTSAVVSFILIFQKWFSQPCFPSCDSRSQYLIFVTSFTRAKFLENKIYTEKRVNYKNWFCNKIA